MGCGEEQAASEPEVTAPAAPEEVPEEAAEDEEAVSGDPAVLLKQGKVNDALAILESTLQEEGAEPQWGLLARAAMESDDPAAVLKRVSFPETLPALGSKLDIALAAGDSAQALATANAMHAKDPLQGNLGRARALIAGAEPGDLTLSAEEPGGKLAEAAKAQGEAAASPRPHDLEG